MSEPPVPLDRSDGPVGRSRAGDPPQARAGGGGDAATGDRAGAPDADRAGGGAGADAGLFGPDSVTWRVHVEPLMGVATLRALLLQALHPVAVAAFGEHATYRLDWRSRLARTAEYVAVTTFGGTTDAMFAASRVRAIHARVRGVLPTGVGYAAEDPQLLAWVHSCFVASFLEVVTRGGLQLSGAEQDAYIAEQVRAAMLVGLEPDEVPRDRAGLQDYFRVIRPALECTAQARRAALDLVTSPPEPPGWARKAGLAYATLPPWGRRLYALDGLAGPAGLADAEATAALRQLRVALRDLTAASPTAAGDAAVLRGLHAARARLRALPDL